MCSSKKKNYVCGVHFQIQRWVKIEFLSGGKKDVIYINAFGSAFIQSDLQCIQSIHI